MTSDFVPFNGQLTFLATGTKNGFLILRNDNPSGLLGNDKEFKVMVRFWEQETQVLKVFFNNDKMDPEVSCNKVFPVERVVPKTQTPARAALELLLKGPLSMEKEQGFFSNINEGVKIQNLTIENGTAKVDFDERMEYQMGGSCRVSAIRAEITETLKQFPSVQNVIISVNGRTEDILQP
jgi:spore germination protein GerM